MIVPKDRKMQFCGHDKFVILKKSLSKSPFVRLFFQYLLSYFIFSFMRFIFDIIHFVNYFGIELIEYYYNASQDKARQRFTKE